MSRAFSTWTEEHLHGEDYRCLPSVHVDAAGGGVVSHAGGVLLVETVRVSGLDRALSAALAPWKHPSATPDPAKVVGDLAVSLALGGDCLADVGLLRAEPGVFGLVASAPTVSGTVDRLAADVDTALTALDGARVAAPERVWWLAGAHAPHAGASADDPLVVDLDATLVTSHAEKENADRTWKKGCGFHPLWAFADHGSEQLHPLDRHPDQPEQQRRTVLQARGLPPRCVRHSKGPAATSPLSGGARTPVAQSKLKSQ